MCGSLGFCDRFGSFWGALRRPIAAELLPKLRFVVVSGLACDLWGFLRCCF